MINISPVSYFFSRKMETYQQNANEGGCPPDDPYNWPSPTQTARPQVNADNSLEHQVL